MLSSTSDRRDVAHVGWRGGRTFAPVVALAVEEGSPSPAVRLGPIHWMGRAVRSKAHALSGHTMPALLADELEVGLRCDIRSCPGPCSTREAFVSVVTTTPVHSNRNQIVGHGVIGAAEPHRLNRWFKPLTLPHAEKSASPAPWLLRCSLSGMNRVAPVLRIWCQVAGHGVIWVRGR
eukprot:1293811-Prymnesium_polylepis.1